MLQTQTINGQTQGVSVVVKHGVQVGDIRKNEQLTVGFLFQLAEHNTGILEVMNLLSSGLDFFSLYFRHCLSTLHHCKDHSHIY